MRPDFVGHKRCTATAGLLLAVLLTAAAGSAAAQPLDPPRAGIVDVGMVGQSLRITIATAGLEDTPDPTAVTVSAWLDGVPLHAALPLIHMPSRFAMDLDLAEGIVRVGGISVGRFAPVAPFRENLRFPVEVTVRRGPIAATARRMVAILLPTVVVPGYLNEGDGPDQAVLAAFRRHGFTDTGAGQNVFWFSYPSKRLTLPESAPALAAYVRSVVLPAGYAARINVVGYSLDGLNARAIPADIRVYLFYGSHDPHRAAGPQTASGITGLLPGAALAYETGDGLILAASAQGLPIRRGNGVPVLIDRAVLRVDLGPVYHTRLLDAGAGKIAGALLDRFVDRVDE